MPLEAISWSLVAHEQATLCDLTTQVPHPGEAGMHVFGTASPANVSATGTSAQMTDGGCTGIHTYTSHSHMPQGAQSNPTTQGSRALSKHPCCFYHGDNQTMLNFLLAFPAPRVHPHIKK